MKPLSLITTLCALLGASVAAEPTKIACVGDSITFGSGIKERTTNSYPAQMGRMLGEGFVVKNFGNSGATMLKKGDRPYWKQKEYAAALRFQPEIVVIKLGTNDTKPQNWQHGAEFAKDYESMIESFRALPSKPKIYICLPVPAFPARWGITDEAINKEIIPATRGIAKATGAKLIDLNTPLKGKAKLVPDKVHPNAAGAKIIAETVAAAIGVKVTR